MFNLTADVLARIADAAEVLGGCVDGVEWGRSHVHGDIEEGMRGEYAFWVLDNMGDQLGDAVKWLFVRAVSREPAWAATTWHEAMGLTPLQYAALAAVARGFFTLWDEHTAGKSPGWRHGI
jgi:hypothetical protein